MTIVQGEKCPRNETLCFLPTVKLVSQLRDFHQFHIPSTSPRDADEEQSAFVKSSKITSTLCDSFLALAHEWKVSSNCDRQERFFMKPMIARLWRLDDPSRILQSISWQSSRRFYLQFRLEKQVCSFLLCLWLLSCKAEWHLLFSSHREFHHIDLRWNTLSPVTSSGFCLYLMNKMRWIPIKIRSYAIFKWFNQADRFPSYL